MGSLNNHVINTKTMIQYHGGLDICDTMTLSQMLNETPMGAIGYSSGREEMQSFVTAKTHLYNRANKRVASAFFSKFFT